MCFGEVSEALIFVSGISTKSTPKFANNQFRIDSHYIDSRYIDARVDFRFIVVYIKFDLCKSAQMYQLLRVFHDEVARSIVRRFMFSFLLLLPRALSVELAVTATSRQ